MIGIIYFIVIVAANIVGTISGLGGGVIIKPVLDFIAADSVATISFYSTTAVFLMSVVAIFRQMKQGTNLNWKIISGVAVGSIAGGILGNIAFDYLFLLFGKESSVQLFQIVLSIITLIFAFCYTRFELPAFRLKGIVWYIICGLILGFLASVMGIGGGPTNMSVLMLLFSLSIKEAAIYSICAIFFSQLSKLITIGLTTGFVIYNLPMLWFVIPSAILGGWLGVQLSKLISTKRVTFIFQVTVLAVLFINIYNGVRIFL